MSSMIEGRKNRSALLLFYKPLLPWSLWVNMSEMAIIFDSGTNGTGLTSTEMLSTGSWTRCLPLNIGYFLRNTDIFWKPEHKLSSGSLCIYRKGGELVPYWESYLPAAVASIPVLSFLIAQVWVQSRYFPAYPLLLPNPNELSLD